MRMRARSLQVLAVALAAPLAALLTGTPFDPLTPWPAAAQPPDGLEALEAAARADPEDHAASCRYAWGLVGAERPADARDAAGRPIAALRARADRRSRRLLGACLYNRGRALEALGETAAAARDYAESLSVRENAVVRARLTELAEGWAADAPPLAAWAVASSGVPAGGRVVDAATANTADRTRWTVTAVGPGDYGNGSAHAYAGALVCGEPRQARVDTIAYDNSTSLSISDVTPRRIGDVPALVIELTGEGADNCGQMDGMMDFTHRALAVVFVEGCQIHVARFRTDSHDCGGDFELTVRFDRQGNVVRSQPRGDTPRDQVGAAPLRAVAQPARP